MAVSHGFASRMGVGNEATYGPEVAATELVCFIEESLDETITEILDNSLCGSAARAIGQQGTKIIEGGFSYPLRTFQNQAVLERFFGTILLGTPVAGQNTYRLDSSIDGKGLTVAIDKTVSVWTYTGYKSSSLTITGTPTDGIIVAVDGFARELTLTSILNTTASLAALADTGNIMLFQDTVFRIRDLTAALAPADAVAISQFAIELNRNLEPVEINSRNRTEALENNFRESTLTFTIPQYASAPQGPGNFFVNAHRNHTPLQTDIVITNGAFSKTIKMPKLIVTDYSASIGGPEFVTHEVTCQIIPDPENANAFMSLQDNSSELEIIEL